MSTAGGTGSGAAAGAAGTPLDPHDWLDVDQVAEWMRVEKHTVQRMARLGRLPARKVGKEWRFSRAALLAWFADPELLRLDAIPPAGQPADDLDDDTGPDPTDARAADASALGDRGGG